MSELSDVNKRLLAVQGKMQDIVGLLEDHIENLNVSLVAIDDNFEVLNSKIDSLHKDSTKEFGEVKSELKKIQAITSYSDKFENLKIVNK